MKKHNSCMIGWPIVILSACSSIPAPKLADGKLRGCPDRPNCVSSETSRPRAKVSPIEFQSSPEVAWQRLKQCLLDMGGEIQIDQGDYIWVTFTSRVFGFVDDMEFRLVGDEHLIHLRSASRVGYSDLGVNRKRVERLHKAFNAINIS